MESKSSLTVDRYGFLMAQRRTQTVAPLSEKQKKNAIILENLRTQKWRKMLDQWDKCIGKQCNQMKTRLRKGIPDALRGEVWCRLSGVR